MEEKLAWSRFLKSGKVTDYLYFVSSKKGGEESGGTGKSLYHKGACDKGNENR